MRIYLLDTNMIVFMLRGLKVYASPNQRQRERHRMALRIFHRAQKQKLGGDQVGLSAITVAELEFGAWNSGDYHSESAAMRAAIGPFSLFPFDPEDSAIRYGEIRHVLESAGQGIGSLDTLIAAQAAALGATLVTSDTHEFCRVPGLSCENWAA